MKKIPLFILLIAFAYSHAKSETKSLSVNLDSNKTTNVNSQSNCTNKVNIIDSLHNVHTGYLVSYSDSMVVLKLESGDIDKIYGGNLKINEIDNNSEKNKKIGFTFGTPGILNLYFGINLNAYADFSASVGPSGSQFTLSYILMKQKNIELKVGANAGLYYLPFEHTYPAPFVGMAGELIWSGFLLQLGVHSLEFDRDSRITIPHFQIGYVFRFQ